MTRQEALRRDIKALEDDIKRIKADPHFVHSLDPTMTKKETIEALGRMRDVKNLALWRLRLRAEWLDGHVWWRHL